VRFLFYDQIKEMEPAKHALGTRAVSIGDEFLPDHYARRALMPSTLVLESVTQVAGWLYIATSHFAITTVLGLVEGVEIVGDARAGDLMELEVWMDYAHRDGATLRGVARVNGGDVLRVKRLMFASRPLTDQRQIQQCRDLFDYLSGGFVPRQEARS
jgi:3-hydroxymyristoyl/3-hydroxydecanoyl-(acyl carrier protein) dehydratase